jgi:putative MATE family efflux protein
MPARWRVPRAGVPPVTAPAATAKPATTPGVPLPRDEAAEVDRAVRHLAWPVIGEQLLHTLVGVVNMVIVGRLGAAQLAGVGAATQLVALVVSAVASVSVGTTVLVARHSGARDARAAGHVTQQSLLAGAAIGVLIALLGWTQADHLIRLLGAEEAVVREGDVYLRVGALGWPALVLMLVAGGAMRGAGDTRTPLHASLSMNAVNVAIAWPLALGLFGLPPLGVMGVAIAAALGPVAGAGVILALLFRMPPLRFTRASWRWDSRTVARVLRIGVPTSVEQTLLSAGFLLYGAMVISLGTAVYAAQRITFQVFNLAFMPAFGYATAATTLTGQSLGAGRPDRAAAATRAALRQVMLWMVATGLVSAAGAWPMMYLFTADPQVIRLGALAMPVLSLAQPFWGISNVYAGSLRGAGDSRFPMLATTLGMWTMRLPLAYLMGIMWGWGLPGVYLSSTFDSGLRSALNYWRYRRGRWRDAKL